MGFSNVAVSALGKLLLLGVLLAVFLGGMAGVVYMSLQGDEIRVPEIIGKNFVESEAELASLGLKIKKRADRVSSDAPNTVVEQMPKAGEIVKTGQLILVVTSKPPVGGEAAPIPKGLADDADDTETIKEMISDKPKKAKTSANTNKKKADTSRDVNTAAGNTVTGSNSGSKAPANSVSGETSNKSTPPPSGTKPPSNPGKPPTSEPKSRTQRP
ncbi:MAG: PASTA domain-containing protein [Blastocatellia bacterium]|nr:PASTA domain-containing protein [Blastocatellia bacterium]